MRGGAPGGPVAEWRRPPLRDYTAPPRIGAPEDPPGWERIQEGSFLEAVLVTQLSGDFPGPVLATVSVPFYSADRQRILVPRGSRVVGTSASVALRRTKTNPGSRLVSTVCCSRMAAGFRLNFTVSINSARGH